MEISIEELQTIYANKSDEELERIATQDAHGLRPEVLEIIEKELQKRHLSPAILKGSLAQNKEYTKEELEQYSLCLRDLACPICEKNGDQLNGTISYTVKSFLIFTTFGEITTVACPDCLDKKNNDAMLSTVLLGWWGIPWGLLKTPVYIYKNMKAKKRNRIEKPNDTLLSFTLANIGRIETYKENKEQLKKLIKPEQ